MLGWVFGDSVVCLLLRFCCLSLRVEELGVRFMILFVLSLFCLGVVLHLLFCVSLFGCCCLLFNCCLFNW